MQIKAVQKTSLTEQIMEQIVEQIHTNQDVYKRQTPCCSPSPPPTR